MPVYIRDLGEDSLYTPGNLLGDFRKKYWWINEINVGDKFIIIYTSDGYLTFPGHMKILMIYKPYFLNLQHLCKESGDSVAEIFKNVICD